ncbi:hypothetical protein, partial [Insolitispirillum peregrinum]
MIEEKSVASSKDNHHCDELGHKFLEPGLSKRITKDGCCRDDEGNEHAKRDQFQNIGHTFIPVLVEALSVFLIYALNPYTCMIIIMVVGVLGALTAPGAFFIKLYTTSAALRRGALPTSLALVACLFVATQSSGLTDQQLFEALITGSPVPQAFYSAVFFLLIGTVQALGWLFTGSDAVIAVIKARRTSD